MVWAWRQGTSTIGANSASTAATFSSSVNVGNLVVVSTCWFASTTTISSVVDNAATPNIYHLAISEVQGSISAQTALYYALVTTGGAFKVTVTWNTAAFAPIAINEYTFTTGVESTTGTAANFSSGGSLSPAAGNVIYGPSTALIAGVMGFQTSAAFTPSTGFTARQTVAFNSGVSMGLIAIDNPTPAGSPQNPGGTITVNEIWSAVGAGFGSAGDYSPGGILLAQM